MVRQYRRCEVGTEQQHQARGHQQEPDSAASDRVLMLVVQAYEPGVQEAGFTGCVWSVNGHRCSDLNRVDVCEKPPVYRDQRAGQLTRDNPVAAC